MERRTELEKNLTRVRARIDACTAAAGRPTGSVRLLPVTKFHPVDDIRVLRDLGVREVGENREQEARAKHAELPGITFHMIGQIQVKKANAVARWAGAVHSVDSIRLADALDRGVRLAVERGDRGVGKLECFVQLSLDGDDGRGGATGDEITDIAEAVAGSGHLALAGLMCVPPLGWDPSASFARAREVLARLEERFARQLEFSAGMSGDMAEAISHGSTIVRVGTDILGPRPLA
ncbi:YggS family pyridoxal phosphate-dependent enzyme [Corynebacterium pacaense]|uniref:YggS family pyridoxal phosphate-dependent enzyme n=1 Tax=Corynebacterium pacaense TaxID=1816684 RepID=UPI0009BBD04C|nr:YggS family pyridoxal phosphate-dependent enzyme [Corynebacterium pacaense]